MFPSVSGSEGSKGFPATRYFTPGNQGSPGRPLLSKRVSLKSIIERDGASGETVGFPELGSSTLFTLPVADIDSIYAVIGPSAL